MKPGTPASSYVDEVTGQIVIEDGTTANQPTIDHKHKVSSHWTSGDGNNSSQSERSDFYSGINDNQADLRIASWSNNSSDGGKAAAEGANYTDEVGPKFTGPGE